MGVWSAGKRSSWCSDVDQFVVQLKSMATDVFSRSCAVRRLLLVQTADCGMNAKDPANDSELTLHGAPKEACGPCL